MLRLFCDILVYGLYIRIYHIANAFLLNNRTIKIWDKIFKNGRSKVCKKIEGLWSAKGHIFSRKFADFDTSIYSYTYQYTIGFPSFAWA